MTSAAFAFFALGAAAANPCASSATILNTASVRALPPSPATLDLVLKASDLSITEADDVRWLKCSVSLRRVFGGWAITDKDLPIYPAGDHLITRDDPTFPPDPEPPHPKIPGGIFLSSTPLAEGKKRAGLWREADGFYVIATYTSGEVSAPRPLILSSHPILGLFYLGAPDTFGGQFSFWQSREDGSYRFVSASWGEAGLR